MASPCLHCALNYNIPSFELPDAVGTAAIITEFRGAIKNKSHICLYNEVARDGICSKPYDRKVSIKELEEIGKARSDLESIIDELVGQAKLCTGDMPTRILSHRPELQFRLLGMAKAFTCAHHRRNDLPRRIVNRWFACIQRVEAKRIPRLHGMMTANKSTVGGTTCCH